MQSRTTTCLSSAATKGVTSLWLGETSTTCLVSVTSNSLSLATSALSAYVMANRDKAHFCTTPDCPMVYRVTSEEHAEVFLCPECSVRTCTACDEQAHDGMTCSMLRSYKETGGGVVDWVRQDPKNRRACPGCQSPVEKISGCNKMHCTACRTVFCWLCTQRFDSEGACYHHLNEEHGGVFTLEDLLQYRQ